MELVYPYSFFYAFIHNGWHAFHRDSHTCIDAMRLCKNCNEKTQAMYTITTMLD